MPHFVDQDELRAQFSAALSRMYREEVPLYGDLVRLVDEINDGFEAGHLFCADRLRVERHGAIRLGKASELAVIARLFSLMGMYPVGYYDLSTSGLPVHATAFRPITAEALAKNPFRVFTSLLRTELISDEGLKSETEAVLEGRNIFPQALLDSLEKAEGRGGVESSEVSELTSNALQVFKWHENAEVSQDTYERMKRYHPLLADIAGFRGPHINHLTPRVLDIDRAQRMMAEKGITPKLVIEGPPKRECPILLRQTSFQALCEPIRFPGSSPTETSIGMHRARFGEIELRGCALTKKGHELYLQLLDENSPKSSGSSPSDDNDRHQRRLEQTFARFPDDWETLRLEQLAYFCYRRSSDGPLVGSLDELISRGQVKYTPIEFEDFLPASAAGIFHSNLGDQCGSSQTDSRGRQDSFERALGRRVLDYWGIYEAMQAESLAGLGF